MTTSAIHRLVEQRAALQGSLVALLDGDRAVSYRDLNYAANALARRLMTSGFRRGGHAVVSMLVGIDLAVVLLAILKAGGSYTWSPGTPSRRSSWSDPAVGSPVPIGLSFSAGSSNGEARYLHLDISSALAEPVACSPNLPIITRGSDVACVLQEAGGSPVVMVPHATIAALRSRAVPQPTPWISDAGAFELWMALMSGTTAVVARDGAARAA